MFPFDEYALVRQRQEEMLKQAAYERLVRAGENGQGMYRTLALWLGTHMVVWGQKLERLAVVNVECPPASLHGSLDV